MDVSQVARIARRPREACCHLGPRNVVDIELAAFVDVKQESVVEHDPPCLWIEVDDMGFAGARRSGGERKQRGTKPAGERPPKQSQTTAHRVVDFRTTVGRPYGGQAGPPRS